MSRSDLQSHFPTTNVASDDWTEALKSKLLDANLKAAHQCAGNVLVSVLVAQHELFFKQVGFVVALIISLQLETEMAS